MTIAPFVVILLGSTRQPSFTREGARRLETHLLRQGCETEVVDVRNCVLPIADPTYHHSPEDHPDENVRLLDATLRRSDAVVLATPVYHGSYSGALKNLLDHARWNAFDRRPVGLLVHGGSDRTGSSVCDHLRTVVRTMFGYATQTQVVTCREDFVVDDDGVPTGVNDNIDLRLARLAVELVHLSRALRCETVLGTGR